MSHLLKFVFLLTSALAPFSLQADSPHDCLYVYGGNSQAPLAEHFGGPALTQFGSIQHSTLNPPDGDQWLSNGFSSTNYYTLNPSVWPGQAQGVVSVFVQYNGVNTSSDQIWLFRDSTVSRFFGLDLNMLDGGRVAINYTNASGAVIHQQAAAGFTMGRTYEIRTEWGSFGVRVKVDGNLILSQSANLELTPTVMELGWTHAPYNRGLILSWLDAFMISCNVDQVAVLEPAPTPTATATPKPCSPGVVAYYGGNSDGQLHDAQGGPDLLNVGQPLANPAGGQPEGDRWLAANFSSTVPRYLVVPAAVWPGSTGALELQLQVSGAQTAGVQQLFFLGNGQPGQYLSLYTTGGGLTMDLTGHNYVHNTLQYFWVPGKTIAVRLAWGSFGTRVSIDGEVIISTPVTVAWSQAPSATVGVQLGNPIYDLQATIDALAVLSDPDAVVDCGTLPTKTPTLTHTSTETFTETNTATLTSTPTDTATPTATATPKPCSPGVVAYYGGNSDGQLHDAQGGPDLLNVGQPLANPAGGQPEGDRWLAANFSSTVPRYLVVPASVWPGAVGALELQLEATSIQINGVQELFFLSNGVPGQYLSLYTTGAGLTMDLTGHNYVHNTIPYLWVPGKTVAVRLAWGSFGTRVSIDGEVIISTPVAVAWSQAPSATVGVQVGNAAYDLLSKIDALAVLSDPDAVVDCGTLPTKTPTLTHTSTDTFTATSTATSTSTPTKTATPTATLDTVPPTKPIILSPVSGTYAGGIYDLLVQAEAGTRGEILVNGQGGYFRLAMPVGPALFPGAANIAHQSINDPVPQVWTIVFRSTDKAGNQTLSDPLYLSVDQDTATPTLTATDTETPTATDTFTHTSTDTSTSTPTVTPTNTPLCRILAEYKGDSDGQFKDSSGHGLNLQTTGGAIRNPSNSEPPQGDRWLASDLLQNGGQISVPLGAVNPLEGCVSFYVRENDNNQFQGYLAIYGTKRVFEVYKTGSGQPLMVNAAIKSLIGNILPAGATQQIGLCWGPAGVKLYQNGVLVDQDSQPFDFGVISSIEIGSVGHGLGRLNSHVLMDDVVFSEGTCEPLPILTPTPTPLLSNTPTETFTHTNTHTYTVTYTSTPTPTGTWTPELRAWYRGDSDGQLLDSSGNARHLSTEGAGAPPQASTPLPPQGDRWLVTGEEESNSRLLAPASVIGSEGGCVEFDLAFRSVSSSFAFLFYDLGVSQEIYAYTNGVGASFEFWIGGTHCSVPSDPMGVTSRYGFCWNADGLKIFKNGILAGQAPGPLAFAPAGNLFRLGNAMNQSSSSISQSILMDNVQIWGGSGHIPTAPTATDTATYTVTATSTSTDTQTPSATDTNTLTFTHTLTPTDTPTPIALGLSGAYQERVGGFFGGYWQGRGCRVDPVMWFDWDAYGPWGGSVTSNYGGAPYFQVNWDGFINVPQTGDYSFLINASAGIGFQIDGLNGTPAGSRLNFTLAPGWHAIHVWGFFFQAYGPISYFLHISWNGPGIVEQALGAPYLAPEQNCPVWVQPTPTVTSTSTLTSTGTSTSSSTASVTSSSTPTETSTTTDVDTVTPTPTQSQTPSSTQTLTSTSTATSSATVTLTPSSTSTGSVTASSTVTGTTSSTVSTTPSSTITPSQSSTRTVSPSATQTATATSTLTAVTTSLVPLLPSTGVQVGAGGLLMNGGTIDSYNSCATIPVFSSPTLTPTVPAGSTATRTPTALAAPTAPASLPNLGNLFINSGQTVTLPAGDYRYNQIHVQAGGRLRGTGGLVRIYITTQFRVNSGGDARGFNDVPGNLWIFGLTGSQVIVNSSAVFYGVIYAPGSQVILNSGATVYGAVVGNQVILNSGSTLHFDQALISGCPSGPASIARARPEDSQKESIPASHLPEGKSMLMAPNPARDEVSVIFKLAAAGPARLTLLNLAGEVVQQLNLGVLAAGESRIETRVGLLANGVYVLVLESAEGMGWALRQRFKVAVVH